MLDKFNFSRFLFYGVCVLTALGLSFGFGLYSGVNKTVVFWGLKGIKIAVEDTLREFTTRLAIRPAHFLQPARHEGSGVTVNESVGPEDHLVFLSGFFENTNELRLIRRNGDIVASWPVQFFKIFPNPSQFTISPKTEWNVDIHGALILQDGSVVFNFEWGGLVKLDRCGDIVWALSHRTHHSVERAENGGFWVPGSRFFGKEATSPFPPFQTPFYGDTIMKVSEEGEVLKEISVPDLFFNNDLEALLTGTGESFRSELIKWDEEVVHLNKVEVLTSDLAADFPMFDVGDIMISIRGLNLVMVIGPDSGKVKWWQVGPWIRQHDPEFAPGGKVIVFNNNNYRTAFRKTLLMGEDISPIPPPRFSNIIEVDPASNQVRIIYGNESSQKMHSIIRGKVEPTSTGGLLITEFEGGRVFEVDANGHIVWEYINRFSPEEVLEITEARLYPASYFNVPDWSCEKLEG